MLNFRSIGPFKKKLYGGGGGGGGGGRNGDQIQDVLKADFRRNPQNQFAKSQEVSNVRALQIFERKVLLSI